MRFEYSSVLSSEKDLAKMIKEVGFSRNLKGEEEDSSIK